MLSYILTGAPGAGKTAVLRLLETTGYPVVEEAATDVIALGNALGRAEPWHDHDFIDKVITLQRQRQEQMLLWLNEVYANGMEPAEKRLLRGIKAKTRRTVKDRW